MTYWEEQCEGASVLTPQLGAQMPAALSLEQVVELGQAIPAPVARLLEKRHCLSWDIIDRLSAESSAPVLSLEQFREGVIDHKATHILHKDNSARFVCATRPRADTVVVHPGAFPEAHRAGLAELSRYPFMRPAIKKATDDFLNRNEGDEADYSIYLSTEVAEHMMDLGLDSREERRVLEAYQTAVLRAANGMVYRHVHSTLKTEPVKTALLLGGGTPHFKALDPRSLLNRPNETIWVLNLAV